mgnify:CR=1 FL=1
MNDLSVDSLLKPLKRMGHIFVAHSKFIFFVLGVSVLISAVLVLNMILSTPSDEEYRQEKLNESQSARFDQETIDKINKLQEREQTSNGNALPPGRISPFSE